MKPRVKGSLLWSERDLLGLAANLLSSTWLNLSNAQFKRQKLFLNILPRVNGPQIYQRQVPIDDWSHKVHRSISKAIQRAMTEGQGWLWFDNAVIRGYIIYLTSVPGLRGFEPVNDVKPVLIDALKSISPPRRDESEGRFRPYGGSQNWKGNAGGTGEEDASRWEVIATSQGPTDFIGIEAECVVAGVDTEYVPPFWRSQSNHGLAMRHISKESFVAFAQRFPENYTLTKSALALGVMHDSR